MEQIAKDKMVEMKFRMRTHLLDGSTKERPEETLAFVFGVERQPGALEKALEGAQAGDRMEVHIPPSQIYGEHDPALLHEIPKEGLISQRIKKGRFYRQMKKGTLISFKILEVRPDTVLVDFNKPMAGISASVELEVLSIRKARKEEISAAVESQNKRSIGCG
jgi:FKBP-type peptidyl-prolyl cis-trans isomerase SlyD